jgi:NAD(P)H-quinone oxidoreductase subunit I
MTEEYELAAFDRHSLNYDNVALGRLPTSVTTDPSVLPLRELAYLPAGEMDPHGVDPDRQRAGQRPDQVLAGLKSAAAVSTVDAGESSTVSTDSKESAE